MGEYFYWVNPKKRERIDEDPFDKYGFIYSIGSTLGNRYTDAACTLLAGPWRGDPVMYVGDYFAPAEGTEIAALLDGCPLDDILDSFRNVGGLFRCAKGKTYRVFDDLLYDELYRDVPYEGPFDMEVRHFRYALNRTRGEYVDRDGGPVKIIWAGNGEVTWERVDPMVPLLTQRGTPWGWDGRWCCDEVEVLDELPAGEFEDITRGGWTKSFGPLIFATDEEMAALASSEEFARELELMEAPDKGDGAAKAVYPGRWAASILDSLRGGPEGAQRRNR